MPAYLFEPTFEQKIPFIGHIAINQWLNWFSFCSNSNFHFADSIFFNRIPFNRIYTSELKGTMENRNKNKEETKRHLIKTVGQLLKSEGPTSLKVNKIAKTAGVDKKLIYRYFKNVDGLIESFILENDYWLLFAEKILSIERMPSNAGLGIEIVALLKGQFNYFLNVDEMQLLVLTELSGTLPLMKSIHQAREAHSDRLLQLIEDFLADKGTNFRAIAGLLVGGIYYMVLHSRSNGNQFAGIDLNSEQGRKAIEKAIDDIVLPLFQD